MTPFDAVILSCILIVCIYGISYLYKNSKNTPSYEDKIILQKTLIDAENQRNNLRKQMEKQLVEDITQNHPNILKTTHIPDYLSLELPSTKKEYIQNDGMKAMAITDVDSLVFFEYKNPFDISTADISTHSKENIYYIELIVNNKAVVTSQTNKNHNIKITRTPEYSDVLAIRDESFLIEKISLRIYVSDINKPIEFNYTVHPSNFNDKETECIYGLACDWFQKVNDIICKSNQSLDRKIETEKTNSKITIKEKFNGASGVDIGLAENKNGFFGIAISGYEYRSQPSGMLAYSYEKIISSEIVEDGDVLTKSNGVIGRAIVGGIVTGGVGAIIGGVTAGKRSSTEATSIKLRITVDDTQNPFHEVSFLRSKTPKGSKAYNDAISAANHWHSLISVLINKKSQEDVQPPIHQQQNNTLSIADELKKLVDLHNAGILTAEELNQQKQKLLNS